MNTAEFDTLRRTLGLSVQETADICGVQERTLRRWMRGEFELPIDAQEALLDLEQQMLDKVDEALQRAQDNDTNRPVILWRFQTREDQAKHSDVRDLPFGAHAILVSWIADGLAASDIPAEIHWADDPNAPRGA